MRKGEVRKILGFLAAVLAGFLLLDYLGYKVLDRLAATSTKGREYNTRLAVTALTPELLFLGASQCQGNYDVPLFEDSLGLDAYNAGMGAQHIDYQVVVANEIIARKRPRIIVWDFDPKLLADDNSVWLKTGLNPHYHQSDRIRNTLDQVDAYLPLKHLLHSYRYNSQLVQIASSRLGKNKEKQGYSPFPCRTPKTMPEVDESDYKAPGPDTERKKAVFASALADWQAQGIKVMVLVSPVHKKITAPSWGVTAAEVICRQTGVPFHDFSQLPGIYDEASYFRDHIHLCKVGAALYSARVAELLKETHD